MAPLDGGEGTRKRDEMSEKKECKGGCGKAKAHGDCDAGGYALVSGDRYLEWVCEECWKKGVRLTAFKDVKLG